MRVAVVTGTFGHCALVQSILDSLEDLSSICSYLVIQYGEDNSSISSRIEGMGNEENMIIPVEFVKYYESIEEFVKFADIVITHAGTGTVLELAEMNVPFVVVPNPELKNNHQKEFCSFLQSKGISVTNSDHIVNFLLKKNFKSASVSVSKDLWKIIFSRTECTRNDFYE